MSRISAIISLMIRFMKRTARGWSAGLGRMRNAECGMNEPSFKITFKSLRAGWATWDVSGGGISYNLLASDVAPDSLTWLLDATIALNEGQQEACVEFWFEPPSNLWHLVQDGDRLHVHCYYGDDYGLIDDDGKSPHPENAQYLNTITTDLKTFTHEILAMFTVMYLRDGVENYEYEWTYSVDPREGDEYGFPRLKWTRLHELYKKNFGQKR